MLGHFFLFIHENLCCGHSLEAPHQDTSNEHPQRRFLWRKLSKNYHQILLLHKSSALSIQTDRP